MRRSTHCFIAYKLLVIDLQTYRVEGGWECTLWIPGKICISFRAGQYTDNRSLSLSQSVHQLRFFNTYVISWLHYSKVIMKITMLISRYFIKYIVIFHFVAQSFQISKYTLCFTIVLKYCNTVLRPYCQTLISNVKLSTEGYWIAMTYGLQTWRLREKKTQHFFFFFLWTYITSD